MNCFQHIPESRGAIAQPPRGGATKKKADPTTQHALIGFKHPHLPQPSALHNRTCPCPLTSDRTRNARAPTSPRSIGFCAIWDCISSSSSSSSKPVLVDKPVELFSGHGPSVIIRISPLPWGLSGIFSRSSRPSSQTCCKCRELWSCNQARKHTHRHWPIFVESGPLPVDKPVAVDRRRAVTQHLN